MVLAFLLGPIGRWVLLAIAFAGAGGLGFLKGADWQQGKQALAEVKVLTKRIEIIRTIHVGQEEIASAYEKGRADREEDFRKLQAEFDQKLRDALVSLPAACTWGDDVVGLLNRARGARRPAADSSKSHDTVPAVKSAYRWETRIGGEANAERREVVLGLSGSAPNAN